MTHCTIVTQAGVGHAVILASLHAASFGEEESWDAKAIESLMALPGTCVWLALVSGCPAGFLMIRTCCDEAEILTLCVTPTLQRQGVARRLLQVVKKNLQENCIVSLFLEVSVNNIYAESLYKSEGFSSVSNRKSYYPDCSDALVMVYDLRTVRL